MNNINLRVLLKEPRGFVRLLQIVFSIVAWSMTANFSTISSLGVYCPIGTPFSVEYRIDYPFDLRNSEISYRFNCTNEDNSVTETFPIDFSCTAMLYVLLCAISLLYSLLSLIYYSIFTVKYETNPLAPMVDLAITIMITFFWIILSCTWAINVSDLKHYTHPQYIKKFLSICSDQAVNCQTKDPGKYSSLTVSIISGFTCVVLWLGSTWFIFKETSLHKKQSYQTASGQNAPQQQAM